MKLNALFNKAVIRAGLALAVMAFAIPTYAASKGDIKKGGQILMEMSAIRTIADAEAVKPGATIAMACSKCKSVVVMQRHFQDKNRSFLAPGTKHGCPGCKSEITVVGEGKGKERVIKHTCKACGDDSAFCCATSKNTGPTKGMEKKKGKK